jgi:hypothetical protein
MSVGRVIAIIAVGLALAGGRTVFAQDPRLLPDTIPDLNNAQLVEIVDQTGQVLLHGTLKTSSNTVKQTDRKADLVSPSGQKAKGKIDIEIERKDNSVKDQVEVSVEGMPTSSQFELRLDGRQATTFLTSKTGRAKFELERKSLPGK